MRKMDFATAFASTNAVAFLADDLHHSNSSAPLLRVLKSLNIALHIAKAGVPKASNS